MANQGLENAKVINEKERSNTADCGQGMAHGGVRLYGPQMTPHHAGQSFPFPHPISSSTNTSNVPKSSRLSTSSSCSYPSLALRVLLGLHKTASEPKKADLNKVSPLGLDDMHVVGL